MVAAIGACEVVVEDSMAIMENERERENERKWIQSKKNVFY
jgi:hypothetical protein